MKSLLNVNSFNSFHSLHMLSAWVKHQIVDIDILMNVHYIYLFGQSGFCLIFILSKNKFSVWTFTENAPFISSHERICSRDSEMSKDSISKDLPFQK